MKKVNAADYADQILKSMPTGILLTTKADDKVNSMVIGWGTMGVNWGKPVFAVYVREGRFTREQLDKNPEFTVNIPMTDTYNRDIIRICGGRSGRDTDKVTEAGLTLIEGQEVSVPAIKEFPLTLECKVVYRQMQDLGAYPEDVMQAYYPQDVDSSNVGANRDAHVTYFGEIVAAYIAE